ncbi:MAG: peptidoglycan editing factor PgeF [Alphaproteobacteria bacterium]|nr:peptidoglycan editing factor PgeF [Alphaproteobacteria bacterium]
MIRSAAFATIVGVRHGFFTRDGGCSSGLYASLNCGFGTKDSRANVAANRALAMAALDLPPERLCTLYQVHGTAVAVPHGPWLAEPPIADAVVTRTRQLALAILTADCAPVLLADSTAQVVAAIHCGWKGTLAGVIEATIGTMEQLGALPARTVAAIGPCIAQPSYEVGADLVAQHRQDPDSHRFFRPGRRADRQQFDLAGYVGHRLTRAGVGTVDCVALDTYPEDGAFFSFRRASHRGESDYGRQLSVIALA